MQEKFSKMAPALEHARKLIRYHIDADAFGWDGASLSVILAVETPEGAVIPESIFYLEDECPMIRRHERLVWEWNAEDGEVLHYDAREKSQLTAV